jgi:hypothetical protein
MGASPVLPSREHSHRPKAYTGEAQHTGRCPFQIEQASSTEWTLHMDIVQAVLDLWGSPKIDLFATKMNNCLPQYMSPAGSESAGSERLGRIMRWHECKNVPQVSMTNKMTFPN